MRSHLTPCLFLVLSACGGNIGGFFPAADVDLTESELATTSYVFPPTAGVIYVTQAPYNAVPNDGTDDTAPIQAAIEAAYKARPQTVYFPDGVYNISDRLTTGDSYKRLTLQGQSRRGTILKLKDSAPGYTDAAAPKDVISFYNGTGLNAVAFRNHVIGLTIDVGAGNAGAVGLRFHASNEGVIRDVKVVSSDPSGLGHSGIRITRNAPGPLFMSGVAVRGFDIGIAVMFDRFSVTMDDVVLTEQRVVGIENTTNFVNIRRLNSTNTVPAIRNQTNTSAGGGGMLTLLDSQLKGGSATGAAIENAAGSDVFVRNVKTTGYANAVSDMAAGATIADGAVTEYLTGNRVVRMSSTATQSLNLPNLNTPQPAWAPVTDWQAVDGSAADDTAAFQAALNSGRSTVFFPRTGAAYALRGSVTVPSTVQRIVGMENVVNVAPGTLVRVTQAARSALVIERFEGFPKLDIAAARTVVMRDSFVGGAFNSVAAGTQFLENVVGNQWELKPGLKVYARQLNVEAKAVGDFNIRNNGGLLSILGLKTEGPRSVIETTNGGETEVMGGFVYPNSGTDAVPGFTDNASRVCLRYYNEPSVYTNAVTDEAASLPSSAMPGFHRGRVMPLYVGY